MVRTLTPGLGVEFVASYTPPANGADPGFANDEDFSAAANELYARDPEKAAVATIQLLFVFNNSAFAILHAFKYASPALRVTVPVVGYISDFCPRVSATARRGLYVVPVSTIRGMCNILPLFNGGSRRAAVMSAQLGALEYPQVWPRAVLYTVRPHGVAP
jgi:hypothetical protein